MMVMPIRRPVTVPGIPTHREPIEGAMFLSQIVSERIGDARRLRRLTQEAVAERMHTLGHTTWYRQTVSQVETGERNLIIDELISLAMVLTAPLSFLLNPYTPGAGLPGMKSTQLDVGGPTPLNWDQLNDIYGFNPSPMFYIETHYEWKDDSDTTLISPDMTVKRSEE